MVDILPPNETEAAILARTKPSWLDTKQATEIAAKLRAGGAKSVVVKLGDQGCLLVEDGVPQPILAPRVKAVDTRAVGDVFNGVLAVALAEGATLVSACEFASVAAALSVTRMGTQAAAPAPDEVDAILAKASSC
jgi:ribokinase